MDNRAWQGSSMGSLPLQSKCHKSKHSRKGASWRVASKVQQRLEQLCLLFLHMAMKR